MKLTTKFKSLFLVVLVVSFLGINTNINASDNSNIVHNYEGVTIPEVKHINSSQSIALNSLYNTKYAGADYEPEKVTIKAKNRSALITIHYWGDEIGDGSFELLQTLHIEMMNNDFFDPNDYKSYIYDVMYSPDYVMGDDVAFVVEEDREIHFYFEGDIIRKSKLNNKKTALTRNFIDIITEDLNNATYFFDSNKDYEVIIDYKKIEKYNIIYNKNGGTGNLVDDNDYLLGDSVALKDAGSLSHENHEFIGWNTKADGTGTSYPIGHIITIDSNIELFAQWKRIDNNISDTPNVEDSQPSSDKSTTTEGRESNTKPTNTDVDVPQTGAQELYLVILLTGLIISMMFICKKSTKI